MDGAGCARLRRERAVSRAKRMRPAERWVIVFRGRPDYIVGNDWTPEQIDLGKNERLARCRITEVALKKPAARRRRAR